MEALMMEYEVIILIYNSYLDRLLSSLLQVCWYRNFHCALCMLRP